MNVTRSVVVVLVGNNNAICAIFELAILGPIEHGI